MLVEKTNIVLGESEREESVLRDVVGVWYPVPPHRLARGPGEFYPTGVFHVTDDQLVKVNEELAKTDAQRHVEYTAAQLRRANNS